MHRRLVLLSALGVSLPACLFAPSFKGTGDDTSDGGVGDGGLGGTLMQTAFIKTDPIFPDMHVGASVALSGDGRTLAIGVPYADVYGADAGQVLIFTVEGTTWTQQTPVAGDNTDTGDLFGTAVALSYDGTTLVVGAPGEASVGSDPSNNGAPGAGAAYVFKNGAPSWIQRAYLKSSNPEMDDALGTSVAVSSDGLTLFAGAPGEDSATPGAPLDNSASNAGAAYVYRWNGTDYGAPSYRKAAAPSAFDKLGASVAVSGDGGTLAVGAVGDRGVGDTTTGAGAVHVFAYDGSMQFYVQSPNIASNENFGSSIALGGDGSLLLVGASGEAGDSSGIDGAPGGGRTRSGATYQYIRETDGYTKRTYIKSSNPDQNDQFGAAVAMTRDAHVLLVGATGEESSATGIGGDQTSNDLMQAGAAYLFSASGPVQQVAYMKASNPSIGASFGQAVAISDDGRTIAVGAPLEDGDRSASNTNSGAVYVFQVVP